MKNFRLLHVVPSMNPAAGGVAEAVRLLAAHLSDFGVESEIASLDADQVGIDLPCRLHALGPGMGFYGFSRSFQQWLSSSVSCFDAVMVHGIWQFHSIAASAAAARGGIPLFVMPHGMLDPWFQKQYPLKHLKKSLYWTIAESRVFASANMVMFTCADEMQLARQSFLRNTDIAKMQVLGFGIEDPIAINTSDIVSNVADHTDKAKNLLFLGRVHPKKGLDIVIRGFAREIPERSNIKLIIAGPGDDAYMATLKKLANECGISNRVEWRGMVRGSDKWNLLQSADLFLLPSHQENFGIAVVESLACSTPVLVSKSVNIWQEIVDANGGMVCNDDFESFSSVLASWYEQTQGLTSKESRKAARLAYLDKFKIEMVAQRLAKMIRGDSY